MNYCWMCNRYWVKRSYIGHNEIEYFPQPNFHVAISIDLICPTCKTKEAIIQ
jgi:hypothetical protein